MLSEINANSVCKVAGIDERVEGKTQMPNL